MSVGKTMKRSKTQALYKYLPGTWIDFSSSNMGDRYQCVANVDHWNSEKLDGINSKRLIRTVNDAVRSYAGQKIPGESAIPAVSGFGDVLTEENCDVRTAKESQEERSIVARVSPLTFFCPKCSKVYQFKDENEYNRKPYCSRHSEKIRLTQIRQIYCCKCGYATDKHPVCPVHGDEYLYRVDSFNFICRKCKKKIPLHHQCPCGERLSPKNALDSSQFFPYNLSLIDLLDAKHEKFIAETDYGKFIVVAYWTGKISKEQLDEIVDKGITSDPELYKKEFDDFFQQMEGILRKEDAEAAAKAHADSVCGNRYAPIVDEVKSGIIGHSEQSLAKHAEAILEYDMVHGLKDHVSLDMAVEVARKLNTNAHPESFMKIAEDFGISDVRACDNIPFVTCSYGYTRVKSEYESGVQLQAFKEEKQGRKNIYAARLNTEGVLFEFDRQKIIKWLLENDFVDESSLPPLDSEEDIKLWFINEVKLDKIKTFDPISKEDSPITFYVYQLIHSLSHLLIRAAAEIGGLGRDSLSEYLFPNIPAVLIYVQNSQGFNLGSLVNTFEAYFDRWLTRARNNAQRCIYDPICIERYGACTECLFLNEISCQHFNKDLDRSLLIGKYDVESKQRTIGFWEEEISGSNISG